MAHQAGAYPSFSGMKRLGVLLLPLEGMLVHRRVTRQHLTRRYPFIHLGGEDTLWEKCLAQEHNTITPPWFECGPRDPESSMLTFRPPQLPVTMVGYILSSLKYPVLWLLLVPVVYLSNLVTTPVTYSSRFFFLVNSENADPLFHVKVRGFTFSTKVRICLPEGFI